MDEGAISWMSLSDEGREALLLTDLNPISLWKHAEINVAGWSSEEDYKADRLSLAQQTLDYLLQFNRNVHAIVNLGKFPIYSKDGDIDTTENMSRKRQSVHRKRQDHQSSIWPGMEHDWWWRLYHQYG